jgi:hypothetical protein
MGSSVAGLKQEILHLQRRYDQCPIIELGRIGITSQGSRFVKFVNCSLDYKTCLKYLHNSLSLSN